VKLPAFNDDEARLLLAKRLLVMRMVEDVDPLYPFTPESVTLLNTRARGVPQVLLQQASMVFDDATKRRVITIDDGYVTELFKLNGENGVVDEVLTEEKPDLEVVDEPEQPRQHPLPKKFAPVNPVKTLKPSGNISPKKGRKPRMGNPKPVPFVSPNVPRNVKPMEPEDGGVDVEEPLDDSEFSSNVKEIDVIPYKPPKEPEDAEENISTQFPDDSWKPLHQTQKPDPFEKPVQGKRVRGLIPGGLPKIRRNEKSKNVAPSTSNESSQRAQIKCPECSKVFTMVIGSSTKEIQCPHCQFRGKIRQ
jgi:DNA-directed RNA polymerase subunit RPC12/RpoP